MAIPFRFLVLLFIASTAVAGASHGGLMGEAVRAVVVAALKNQRASGWADVNGGRLHYEIYGRGPALVFLHAGIADSRMWDEQVRYFSDRYTVVRFDMRGFGQSNLP